MRAFFSFFLRPFYNFSILFLIADFKNSAETTHVSASEIMKVHHFGQKKSANPKKIGFTLFCHAFSTIIIVLFSKKIKRFCALYSRIFSCQNRVREKNSREKTRFGAYRHLVETCVNKINLIPARLTA